MAEGDVSDKELEEEKFKPALKVNGRYVSHWRSRDHSLSSLLKWTFLEKDDLGIGRTWRDLYRLKTEV